MSKDYEECVELYGAALLLLTGIEGQGGAVVALCRVARVGTRSRGCGRRLASRRAGAARACMSHDGWGAALEALLAERTSPASRAACELGVRASLSRGLHAVATLPSDRFHTLHRPLDTMLRCMSDPSPHVCCFVCER